MRVSFGKFIPVDIYMNRFEIPKGKRKPVESEYKKLGEENSAEKRDILKKFTTQMSFQTFPKDTALTEQQRIVFRANNPLEYMTPKTNARQLSNSEVICADIAGQKYIVCGQQDISFVKKQKKLLDDEMKFLEVSLDKVESTTPKEYRYGHRVFAHKKVPYENAIISYMNFYNRISEKKLEIYATQESASDGKYSVNFIDFVDKENGKPIKFAR